MAIMEATGFEELILNVRETVKILCPGSGRSVSGEVLLRSRIYRGFSAPFCPARSQCPNRLPPRSYHLLSAPGQPLNTWSNRVYFPEFYRAAWFRDLQTPV